MRKPDFMGSGNPEGIERKPQETALPEKLYKSAGWQGRQKTLLCQVTASYSEPLFPTLHGPIWQSSTNETFR